MSYSLKRNLPNDEKRGMRIKLLKKAQLFSELPPEENQIVPNGFEHGNKKTGKGGKVYKKILVWNMPYVITCPGATEWCLSNCYNADDRLDVYPINEWCTNLWWFINKRDVLLNTLRKQLEESPQGTAVRLHSSGDFFSNEYIDFWIKLIKLNPKVRFWGYTRSWRVAGLKNKINEIYNLDNVNLFASWDTTTREQPNLLRKCIVLEDTEGQKKFDDNSKYHICAEQFSRVKSCSDCGFCMSKKKKDLIFILH